MTKGRQAGRPFARPWTERLAYHKRKFLRVIKLKVKPGHAEPAILRHEASPNTERLTKT